VCLGAQANKQEADVQLFLSNTTPEVKAKIMSAHMPPLGSDAFVKLIKQLAARMTLREFNNDLLSNMAQSVTRAWFESATSESKPGTRVVSFVDFSVLFVICAFVLQVLQMRCVLRFASQVLNGHTAGSEGGRQEWAGERTEEGERREKWVNSAQHI